MRDALAAVVDSPGSTRTPLEQRDLTSLYERSAGMPVWIDAGGWSMERARAGLALLERAFEDGLDPSDYLTPEMDDLSAGLAAAPSDVR